MEFCITIVGDHLRKSGFSSPERVVSAFGEAVRAEQFGKLFWSADLYIVERQLPLHLRSCLPLEMQKLTLETVTVGGQGLSRFEASVRKPRCAGEENADDLTDMIDALLTDDGAWAFFAQRDCEDIKHIFAGNRSGLCETLARAFRRESPEQDGFVYLHYGGWRN